MELPGDSAQLTAELLARLRAFLFGGDESTARLVRAVRTIQRGEFRTAPGAKWMPFTAEEFIDANRSAFRWEARFGGGRLGSVAVTDAYEEGHGRLVIKLGGVVPVKKVQGPEVDRGELQRYLAGISSCPPIVLNHRSLAWTASGPVTLRLSDQEDPGGATVDLELAKDGRPLVCRGDRPRLVGKRSILTPWSGTGADFKEWEGFRAARQLEAAWLLPEGPFTYFRAEVTSLTVSR
jgi:hypothetical protein